MEQPNPWRQLVRSAMSRMLPRRYFLVRGPANQPFVSLTFDDGPHPEYTPRLLDQLAEHRVRATFFVIGREAEAHPELVQRMVQEGHQVGNHTWHHKPPREVKAQSLVEEVWQTQQLLEALTGGASPFFRPPLGKLTAEKLWRIWRLGLTVVLWSVDPRDYQAESVEELRSRLRGGSLRGGDILLMHDNQPFAGDVVGEVVELARSQQLEFVTLQRMLGG